MALKERETPMIVPVTPHWSDVVETAVRTDVRIAVAAAGRGAAQRGTTLNCRDAA